MQNTSRITQARQLVERQQWDAAAGICTDILADDPNQAEANYMLGLSCHGRGDNVSACDFFEKTVRQDPGNPKYLFNFGVVLLEAGRVHEAIDALNTVVELAPQVAEGHFNLGNAYFKAGNLDEALACFRKSIDLNPKNRDAHFNMGIVLKTQQQFIEAATAFEEVLKLDPQDGAANFELSLVFHAQGRLEVAEKAYLKTALQDPGSAKARYNLGILYREMGRAIEAVRWFKEAQHLEPENARIANNLGLAFQDADRLEDAEKSFHRAISLDPRCHEAWSNIGAIDQDRLRFDAAVESYRKALAIAPGFHKAWYNLGNCKGQENKPREAAKYYRQAIFLKPDLAEAHWNLSHVLLLEGHYEEGFKEYAWRWKRKLAVAHNIAKPLWQGQCRPEATLLVHTEQGMGDSIQFARILPLVKQRVGRLFLSCENGLRPLFQSLSGVTAVLEKKNLEAIFHAVDFQIPLMDCPALFHDQLPQIFKTPYLSVDRKRAEAARIHFAPFKDLFKVGIVWRGNPEHKNDLNRSCRLEMFSSLFELPRCRFFSLQKVSDDHLADYPVTDLAPFLETYADTGAMIACLDLIISVDTSVAHLAGALAKPVWTLLPYVPDWRWMLDREDCPWYPTMRLFRQKKRGDWLDVFQTVRNVLNDLLLQLAD